jgi:hypothetical protein
MQVNSQKNTARKIAAFGLRLNEGIASRPHGGGLRVGKDGGDIGCRYTPEMIEMCKKALELRAKGIIKF